MLHFALLSSCLLMVVPGDSPTPEELRVYEAAAAKASRHVAAHIRLASWCELHGMQVAAAQAPGDCARAGSRQSGRSRPARTGL